MIGPIVAAMRGTIDNIQLEWWSIPIVIIVLALLVVFAWWMAGNKDGR